MTDLFLQSIQTGDNMNENKEGTFRLVQLDEGIAIEVKVPRGWCMISDAGRACVYPDIDAAQRDIRRAGETWYNIYNEKPFNNGEVAAYLNSAGEMVG